MQDFTGKTAVITGAASGIGLAMAEAFAAQGMHTVMADIDAAALAQAVAKVQAQGGTALGVPVDVAKAEDVQRLANTALVKFKEVHIVCNNAGVWVGGQLWEGSLADYRWLSDVNIWGVIHGIRTFVPIMMSQDNECHMVNTSSMAGFTAMPFSGIYHMTKHAVVGLSESLYKEMNAVAPKIKVSLLCPELVDTGIFHSDRNRPAQHSGSGDLTATETTEALRASTVDAADKGCAPAVIAERTLQAIRKEQFYIFPEGEWRRIANLRLDEIREGRNPVLTVPDESA